MKIRKETKIGIVAVVAIALLYFGFNFLKGINVFNKPTVFYGVYHRINGLETSNPVLLNGFKVGQVRNIEFADEHSGNLLVTMSMEKNIDIPSDTRALLKAGDLLGSMQVHLILGTSTKLAQSGDTLTPDVEADLVEEVNAQIRPIKMKAESLISSVDSVIRVIEVILNPHSQQNLIESFRGINHAIASLQRTAFRIDTLVQEERETISNILANIDNLSQTLSENSGELSNIISNFSQISDTLAKADVAQTITRTNSVLAEVEAITRKINSGEGSIGMLLHDPDLYKRLEAAGNNLDLLMEDIRVNPNRYLHLSVFGRKDKNIQLSRSELEELKKYIESESNEK